MKTKIKVDGLYKIFGKGNEKVYEYLDEGKNKEEILEQTGCAVGVNNVSFEVNEGEIFIIMGLSGSGKSTLIRCLNLLNKPSKGDIYVDGENIVTYSKAELQKFRQDKIAMVFQHFGLLNHRTVLENVEYGLEIKNIPKDERIRIGKESLEIVGLKGWEDYYISKLSGGMKQRVGLARALANDPEILLMDEPFSALDPLIKRDMHDELLEIQGKIKKTIIFITHDVNEAFKLGDRIAVMKDGEIVQVGTPEEILNNPANDYIEDFIKDIDRSRVLRAKSIMKEGYGVGYITDKPTHLINKMQKENLNSIYILNENMTLVGLVTKEDCIKARNKEKEIRSILREDYFKAKGNSYLSNLVKYVTKSKFPIAVVNDEERFLGVISPMSILKSLIV
ncbi:MAG: glycine betaine/L-proline ABC transporter ATP-binding protein [Anaeromicrobium sp.]|uniref:quaternary amine ABC transporter ATP-binding protein n=1 Tax=Anaeromicrobium sp. TaxID=1929132 RepID=UPI0025EE0F73|nr:glycine betaine/L-proline ABC transporter ATP-binding protein [Anaeromicrobium sp.]MCT4596125.1 glycine betaine/L-proline ABC transporter ATP-binding protein [Anaeromicrobium sp.]